MADGVAIEDVFQRARGIEDPEKRKAFLDTACGGDAPARERVEALLGAFDAAGSFLEAPACAQAQAGTAYPGTGSAALEQAGDHVGPYRLLEKIGEGGFGVVWMAEQERPVRRKVALKVVKPGLDTGEVIARFEAERQALALMEHEGIAKVFDAGATASGRPYFVMELVHGVPITEFCDEHRLPTRERLALFAKVCLAVQHAHAKGVVHRDVKPSNVLVTLREGVAVPKVIDFGIAKATGQRLTDKTLFTRFAQLVGTPLYMSPEQAEMGGLDVDTRSDVYGLGVLLYELLTGTTPLDAERLKSAAFDEVRRMVREEEPPRPSTRLSTMSDVARGLSAEKRASDPKRLGLLVRGELDWIVMKALEKDRDRRYPTASAFADDVARYLADEPVTACPPAIGYRMRKFARRNKAAVAAAAGVVVVLVVVAGTLGWAARERRDRDLRNGEAVEALLARAEEALATDDTRRAGVALEEADRREADGGAESFRGRLAQTRAALTLLRDLDAVDAFRWTWTNDAGPTQEDVLAGWRSALARYGVVPGEGSAEATAGRVAASVVRDRALTALDLWLLYDGSARVRDVLRRADPDPYREAVRDALVAKDAPASLELASRPDALRQPAGFAIPLGVDARTPPERRREVMESALRTRPGDLNLLMELARTWFPAAFVADRARGPKEPGDPRAQAEVLRWSQAAVAAHPETYSAWNTLGVVHYERHELDGALAAYREAIRIEPTLARAHYNVGVVLHAQGHVDEAKAAYLDAIRLNPTDVEALHNIGEMLSNGPDPAAAIPHLEAAVRYGKAGVAGDLYDLALARQRSGDLEGAVEDVRKAVVMRPEWAEAQCNLGVYLMQLGRFEQALGHLRRGHELGSARPDWKHPSASWIETAERGRVLQGKLPAVLAGGDASPGLLLALARHCLQYERRYADAVDLFARAFAADPALAEDRKSPRYYAAKAAALASAGKGVGGDALDPSARARLRARALEWLSAELPLWRRAIEDHPESAPATRAELSHWLKDPDLAPVRELSALPLLPHAERERWTALWDEIRSHAAAKPPGR
jgi:serine/threonine protein kinase/tetratricopeptide (TPR) repeat protein